MIYLPGKAFTIIIAVGKNAGLKKQITKADMYGIERHWYTWGPMVPYYHATQPWVVGFNGEVTLGGMNYGGIVWARLWIDQELKKEMGY